MISTISTVISRLESLVQKAKLIIESIYSIQACQSKEQYCSLKALNSRLQEAIVKVAGRIERLKEGRTKQIYKKGGKFLIQAKVTRESIIKNK